MKEKMADPNLRKNSSLLIGLLALFTATGIFILLAASAGKKAPSLPFYEGTVYAYHLEPVDGNYRNHVAGEEIVLETSNERLKLKVDSRLYQYHNAKIKLRANKAAGFLIPDFSSIEVIKPATPPLVARFNSSNSKFAQTAHAATNNLKMAAILVTPKNDTAQPYPPDAYRTAIFTGTKSQNSAVKELSLGKYALTGLNRSDGDIYGWYAIDYEFKDIQSCQNETGTIISKAKSAAAANGFNENSYDYFAIHFSKPCAAFSSGKLQLLSQIPITDIHELGHSFGLSHANSFYCGSSSAISNLCASNEYGDHFDTMGDAADKQRHFNGESKARLAYFGSANIATISAVGTTEYVLAPLETSSTKTQVIKMFYGDLTFYGHGGYSTKKYTGNADPWYVYLEYRQPIGTDSVNYTNRPAPNGVFIHFARSHDSWKSTIYSKTVGDRADHLIDTTPNSQAGDRRGSAYYEVFDAALTAGRTWTDGKNLITVTVMSATSSEAKVRITYNNDAVSPSIPTNLRSTSRTDRSISLAWNQSTDNVGVAGYNIYRRQGHGSPSGQAVKIGATTSTAYTDSTVSPGGSYWYSVSAFDAKSHESAVSPEINVQTCTLYTLGICI